jgi:hypothetical protein
MTARIIKGITGMVAMAAIAGALISLSNPQSRPLCVKIADTLALGGDCTIPVQAHGTDEYTKEIFSKGCRWVYREETLLRHCNN